MSRSISLSAPARRERSASTLSLAICCAFSALVIVLGVFAYSLATPSEREPLAPKLSAASEPLLPVHPTSAMLDLSQPLQDGEPVLPSKATLQQIYTDGREQDPLP